MFTAQQVSYTSWFLDAFNYALHLDIDVLNLSVGGPDFADLPFVEKVSELTANGIIIVSAIGNDGPLRGSLNNPADLMDVIGVGGLEPHGTIADFSSRGMTLHESQPGFYGRVKPDLVAYGRGLVAASAHPGNRCRKLSGTSVASPVVAGTIALLMSAVPTTRRRKVVNPASIKLILTRSARQVHQAGLYEQGAGLLDIDRAYEELLRVDTEFVRALEQQEENNQEWIEGPKAGTLPRFYDLTKDGCPYMWPHCAQPLYVGGLGAVMNVTVLHPGGAEGQIGQIWWVEGKNAGLLRVEVRRPERFWPWAAGLGVRVRSRKGTHVGKERVIVEGVLKMEVLAVHKKWKSQVEVPMRIEVAARKPKQRRILWDVYHSIQYPPGYVPKDGFKDEKEVLDWLGDHPHTNLHMLFRAFINSGFEVDILDRPVSCMQDKLGEYGALVIIDSEDFFSKPEIDVIQHAVKKQGMSLIIAAEWYNTSLQETLGFHDDNTRSWWTPIIGGANIPGLNELLSPLNISLSDEVVSGRISVGGYDFGYDGGTTIARFPKGGEVLRANGLRREKGGRMEEAVIWGISKVETGAVMVYGDSGCVDTTGEMERCYEWFVKGVVHTVDKCAGGKPALCEKLWKETEVLHENGLNEGRGVGRDGGRWDVFEAHSRTKEGLSGECGRTGWEDVRRVQGEGSVEFPKLAMANPVGKEAGYYSVVRARREVRRIEWGWIMVMSGAIIIMGWLCGQIGGRRKKNGKSNKAREKSNANVIIMSGSMCRLVKAALKGLDNKHKLQIT